MIPTHPSTVRARRRSLLLFFVLFLALMTLTACDGEDADFAAEMAQSWAEEKGLLTASGDINVVNIGILYGQRAILGSTGDPDVDAALGVAEVAKRIKDADALAQQGAQQGGEAGLAKLDQAIAARPSDWSYQEQKAALLLAEGRNDEAAEAISKSNELVQDHLDKGGDCRMYARNLLTQRVQAMTAQISRLESSGQQVPPALQGEFGNAQNELDLLYTDEGACN